MFENLFEPPIIGPFVEPNGRGREDGHTGARITWTAAGEAYRLDVLRKGFLYDALQFEQLPGLDFERFCWLCFEHSTRLREFLNELRPYFRPSGGAPTNAPAGQWFHPKLVAHDFTLGTAKFRKDSLRVPVVWVFGGHAEQYGARTSYSKVGLLDWSPKTGPALNLGRYRCCRGTAASALQRLLRQLVTSIGKEPLLTEKGTARMEELYQYGIKRTRPTKPPVLLGDGVKSISARLRKGLGALSHPLSEQAALDVDRLPEKAYTGILRTCTTYGCEDAACALLKRRRLPDYGRKNLLQRFIDLDWLRVWAECGPEAEAQLNSSSGRFGSSDLLRRALEVGDPNLLSAILGSLSALDYWVAQYILEQAFDEGRDDIADAIMGAPAVKPHLRRSLIQCFSHGLEAYHGPHYCKRPDLAMHLLDMGLRPTCAFQSTDIFLNPRDDLLEKQNLPTLKRVLELEPPTQESVTALMAGDFPERTETLDYLVGVSRNLPGHRECLSSVAIRAAFRFIREGKASAVQVLQLMLAEGAMLSTFSPADFAGHRLLVNEEEQGNWLDLIGHLAKSGHSADAEFLKQLGKAIRSAKKPPHRRKLEPP
ncbi:MAG: hypothetical protein ACLQM8_01295 [Limisphaerales bacterium]